MPLTKEQLAQKMAEWMVKQCASPDFEWCFSEYGLDKVEVCGTFDFLALAEFIQGLEGK